MTTKFQKDTDQFDLEKIKLQTAIAAFKHAKGVVWHASILMGIDRRTYQRTYLHHVREAIAAEPDALLAIRGKK